MTTAEKVTEIRQFVQQGQGDEWRVEIVEDARIPFLQLPCWIVTCIYLGDSKHVEHRTVRYLVVEKEWQLHLFDVTDLLNLNDRLAVNDKVHETL